MSMTHILAVILITMLADNLVTLHMFGAGNLTDSVSDLPTAVSTGGVIGSCSAIAAMVLWPVDTWVLTPLGVGFFRVLLCVLISTLLTRAETAFIRRCWPDRYEVLKDHAATLEVNSAVLGATLLAPGSADTFGGAVLWSVSAGLGFFLVIVLYAGIRIRLEFSNCPRAFQGFPIAMISLALLALAFSGFTGMHV
jgi:electron transport complex protein RnfA